MSWKILTLLLLLLSMGAPILRYFAGAGYDFSDYYIRVCPTAEAKAESCPEGSIEKEYYLTLAEAYNYFVRQGFDKDSWQFDNAFDGYAQSMDSLRGCQLYIEGGDIVEISDYFSIDEVDIYWDNNNIRHVVYHGYLIDRLNLRQTPQGESDSDQASRSAVRNTAAEETREVEFTPEIAKLIMKDNEESLSYIRQYLHDPLEERVKGQMEVFEPNYEEAKKDYEAAAKAYEADKSKVREYIGAKLVKEGYDIFFDAINRTDFSEFEDKAQKRYLSLLLEACGVVRDGYKYAQMSERDFNENGGASYMGEYFKEYGDYVKAMEQRQEQYYRTVREYCYSLEHNVPMDSHEGGSTRSAVEDSLYVNITVIMLMGIFMASVIVAGEHTSGAVRLLMIRPRARWKILLSKLCCLLLCIAGWITATSALSTATNSIIYGGRDLFAPYIMVGSKSIAEVTPLLYYLWKMTVYFLPSLSMVFLAFLMSALIKHSVVSAAIPMIINFFGGSASALFIGEPCKKCPPLKFTPIPYFDLSSFWADPAVQLNAYNSPLDYGLTLGMGVLMFVAYSLILLVLAFFVFEKQQIKN